MADSENFARVLDNFPQQINEVEDLGKDVIVSKELPIVICGVGGSGLPGEVVKHLARDVSIVLVKDYSLPSFISNKTIFVVSYSGNTEETLELYEQAKNRGTVIAVTSGGELAQRAAKDKNILIKVPLPKVTGPSGFQPRMAVGYQTIPTINVLSRAGIIDKQHWKDCADFLEHQKSCIKEEALKIAKLIGKRIPIVYASDAFSVTAYKWKINLNENAKMHAFCHAFPEWNHHEINAYEKESNTIVFILKDREDHPRIKRRMDIIEKILQKNQIQVRSIESKGNQKIERMFWMMYLGDWVSYYVAMELGVDPTPIKMVEGLKAELRK